MRKRKNSELERVSDNGDEINKKIITSVIHASGDDPSIKVVPFKNVVWLCIGLIIGCICGGPWVKELEDKLYGYRWNYLDRCILETPESGYGVDFCRTPVNCDMCRDVKAINEVHASKLSWQKFYENYADKGRPLVIRNATLDWPAMSELNYEWIKNAYLSDPEILNYEDKECWYNNYKTKHLNSLRSVFRMSENDVIGSDWYVGWAVCHQPVAELLHSLYYRPEFLHPESTPPTKPWIFIGSPGPGAHVHIDNVDMSSWQAQISGVKTWLLRPPPECWWQCHGDMFITAYPGDIIVVNTNIWFHSTKIEGPDLSLVITNEFD